MISRRAENRRSLPEDISVQEKPKGFKIRRSSFTQKLHIYWRYIFVLLIGWLLLIQYYERTVVKRAMKKCDWDQWEEWDSKVVAHRVGLYADPQIMDLYSYPSRPTIVNWFTRQILDNYHARNWKFFHYYMKPDSVFFLGDLFDGGRNWEVNEWITEYKRFNSIFPKKPGHLTVMSLPGNHDIGFGDTIIESSLERFTTFFGDPSSQWTVGNHTFVLLDTISLSDRQNENISAVPRDFMHKFEMSSPKYPRILLTHVPLFRNPIEQPCGKMREAQKPFPLMKGHQYQTVIDEDLSKEVLSAIQPKIVFSGDDHDYCHVNHSYFANNLPKMAEEITVKSCAMNMGISKPAIQLISLYNPENDDTKTTYKTNICYFPNPYKPIISYCVALSISAVLLFWMTLLPLSFNETVVKRLPFRNADLGSILPIAVKENNAISINAINFKAANWRVEKERSFVNFLLNMIVLISFLFFVFSIFYKGK